MLFQDDIDMKLLAKHLSAEVDVREVIRTLLYLKQIIYQYLAIYLCHVISPYYLIGGFDLGLGSYFH